MSQPDEFLVREAPEPLWPEPDTTCSDCGGSCVLDGEPCVYCDGLGYREPRVQTYAELRESVRFTARCIEEPMYQVAVSYLLRRSLSAADEESCLNAGTLGTAGRPGPA